MTLEDKSITPEKQLLRLIEDPNVKNDKRIEAKAVRHFGLSLFSFAAWIGRFSFLRDSFRRGVSARSYSLLDIKIINDILFISIFILGFYFMVNFYHSMNSLKKMPNLELTALDEIKPIGPEEGSAVKKAATYYLEKITMRDIFKRGPKITSGPAEEGPSSKTVEAAQNLKLVGISWSDNPDVMIEDTKALKTFFVKRGQMIGELKIEAIFKDKVILSYRGEEIELK